MSLDLRDVSFFGPALPEPFVQHELEAHLHKAGLLRKAAELQNDWEAYRRTLAKLGGQGGRLRVAHHVLDPLAPLLGCQPARPADPVTTREGQEDGGLLLCTTPQASPLSPDPGPGPGGHLRVWSVEAGTDLDAPARRGRAYRFSPSRIAERVLLCTGERAALLTDGEELRLLLCDPAGRDSHIAVRLDAAGGWRSARSVPDSLRLLIALAAPAALPRLPALIDEARLHQTRVTALLRQQARQALEGFLQGVLDHGTNAQALAARGDPEALAHDLWREGLVLIYRLLFLFKLEASPDPARAFSFASTALWRQSYSPSLALWRHVRRLRDEGKSAGGFLEASLRATFRLFVTGLSSSELHVSPLGGMLFGPDTTARLDALVWGEHAVAHLLDGLLWTPAGPKRERRRVHYGSLDVEDLGRVYEALLELEPGIATGPMCRLRRQKLEVVVPLVQGERYRSTAAAAASDVATGEADSAASAEGEADDEDTEAASPRPGKTRVEWIEEIATGRFYLRVGLGRKASGSYYTPDAFVRFLVQETLRPQVAALSPPDDPQPGALLGLKVLDPAMGSGHFLVAVCRFLGDALYEACRLCDELADQAERRAAEPAQAAESEALLERARILRRRLDQLPDPSGALVSYLPSRILDAQTSGLSQWKARALSRRLVAVHCLYGVDKNPLAVELAKLALWLESYAEGLPLTFLDHRLLCGDSLTGPMFSQLTSYPGSGQPISDLFTQHLASRLGQTLEAALAAVAALEASVGKDLADLEHKRAAKARLDTALQPFRQLAAAWSGGVLLGRPGCDDLGYEALLRAVAERGDPAAVVAAYPRLEAMIARGEAGIPFDLALPEVFFPQGTLAQRRGFDAVLGNPPWDALQPLAKEFFAAFDLDILNAPTRRERAAIEQRLTADPAVGQAYRDYVREFDATKTLLERCYQHVNRQAHGQPSGAVTDIWQGFAERGMRLLREDGRIGWVLPSAFHANQSATGIRALYLGESALEHCYSFENRQKLFEIHGSFKFATVVARRSAAGTQSFGCAFYLHDLDWLSARSDALVFDMDLVHRTGGEYLSLLELRTPADLAVAAACYGRSQAFGQVRRHLGISTGEELHMSKSSHLFTPVDEHLGPGQDPRDPAEAERLRPAGYLPLHEGKTFHQFDDHWGERPRYLVALEKLADKPGWLAAAQHFRLAFRDIASSTNERTGIFAILPPGVVFGNTAPCERTPDSRSTSSILLLCACVDSFPFDWTLRQKSAAHVNLFILDGCPVPAPLLTSEPLRRFLAHAALRLSCNHNGYAPLWREQLGDLWREPDRVPHTFPVLAGEAARSAVRAAVDAAVAHAYGLSRAHYAHVLASFSHASHPDAPAQCLAAYDEYAALGLDEFVRVHDPYADQPLITARPAPVLQLAGAAAPAGVTPLPVRRGKRGTPYPQTPQLALLAAEPTPVYRTAAPPSAAPPPPEIPAAPLPPPEAPDPLAVLRNRLQEQGSLSSAEAQMATGLDAAQVRPLLRRLVEEGHAVAEGAGRGTRYRHRQPAR